MTTLLPRLALRALAVLHVSAVIVLVGLAGALLAGILPALLGDESFVVASRSMQPALQMGDLAIVGPVSADRLAVEAAGIQVVGEAADGEQAIQVARELRPDQLDLVLIDVDLPRLDGISAARQLIHDDPELAVVMLTLSTQDRDLVESVRSGAVGFLNKNLAPDALVRALHGFQRGESLPMSRAMGQKLLGFVRRTPDVQRTAIEPPPPSLTRRENEVLELVAQGARDREIAQEFVISESTVKKHVQNILRKLQARNRAEAVARLRDGAA